MSKNIISSDKLSSMVSALILSRADDSTTMERFQAELNAQMAVREEVCTRATAMLTANGVGKSIPGLAKRLEHAFTKEGKDLDFVSRVAPLLKTLTGNVPGDGKPFGSEKGRDGGTFLWTSDKEDKSAKTDDNATPVVAEDSGDSSAE